MNFQGFFACIHSVIFSKFVGNDDFFRMQARAYQGLKSNKGQLTKTTDFLVTEAPLEININGTPFTVVMRTPGDDHALIRGLLYAEDIYKGSTPVHYTLLEQRDDGATRINVTIPEAHLGKGYLTKRSLLSVSSCGICGTTSLEHLESSGSPLEATFHCSSDQLFEMMERMRAQQQNFQQTGGSHAAAIFANDFSLLCLQEDIGRHNAVDKCVGTLLDSHTLPSAVFLLVSGRVSYEIVIKAFLAKIPVIVAVSACSTMAVDMAKEFGICLIGFSRNPTFTIYSNPLSLNLAI